MTKDEAKKLKNGVYKIFWKYDGGSSLASVGRLHDGTPWFAPSNWVSANKEGIACTEWRMVEYIVLVTT